MFEKDIRMPGPVSIGLNVLLAAMVAGSTVWLALGAHDDRGWAGVVFGAWVALMLTGNVRGQLEARRMLKALGGRKVALVAVRRTGDEGDDYGAELKEYRDRVRGEGR